jgi:hypothetical protein
MTSSIKNPVCFFEQIFLFFACPFFYQHDVWQGKKERKKSGYLKQEPFVGNIY